MVDKITCRCQGPTGSYGPVGQAVRQSIPHETICSMFCGGKKCYFCSADKWKDDEQAIKGLYSHWLVLSLCTSGCIYDPNQDHLRG